MTKNPFTLDELSTLIKQKISNKEEGSYTYSLFEKGLERINRKVGEEAIEVIVGSFAFEKNPTPKNHQELVGELCDLFYHSLVLMAAQGIEMKEVLQELEKRSHNKK